MLKDGLVIDFNSRTFNAWAVVNEQVVAELPFDLYEHGIETPSTLNLFCAFGEQKRQNSDYMKCLNQFWEQKKQSFSSKNSQNFFSFVANKIVEILEPLSSLQVKSILSSIVVTGGFVTQPFLEQLEREISNLIDLDFFAVNVIKKKFKFGDNVHENDCHLAGALVWYEKKILEFQSHKDPELFCRNIVWVNHSPQKKQKIYEKLIPKEK